MGMRVMWDMFGWLNQNSGAAQAMLTAGLVLFAAWQGILAWSARSNAKRLARAAADQAAAARAQADASVKMADEMQEQRLESLRPIVDVVVGSLKSSGLVAESLRLRRGKFSDKLPWEISNIGVGPALEVEVSLSHPSQVFETYKVGTLRRGSPPISISLKEAANAPYSSPPPSGSSVVATYVDVNGRQGQSKRELTFDPDNGIIHGHLVVTPLQRQP